jgi:hypothetical protein
MQSKITSAMRLELEPVALIWADEKPAGATEFAPGKWGCVMFHLAAAAKGKTAAISRETFGCVGGGVGLGFGNQYKTSLAVRSASAAFCPAAMPARSPVKQSATKWPNRAEGPWPRSS